MAEARRLPPRAPTPRARTRFRDLLVAARPRQWTKNTVCLAAVVFSGRLGDAETVRLAALTFVAFCLGASGIYVFNDVQDRDEDRAHPRKRERPVAAGRLGTGAALAEATALLGAALAVAWPLPLAARSVLGLFVVLHLAYGLSLKRIAILDVMAIALGFVLRVQAGILAIAAAQSEWIVLCMFFAALFLACGKRRVELAELPPEMAGLRRQALGAYSIPLLDALLTLSAATTIVCYSLYAVNVQPSEMFLLTILPVVFGIGRYLMLVMVQTRGEDPTELFTRDAQLLGAVTAWAALSVAVLYGGARLG